MATLTSPRKPDKLRPRSAPVAQLDRVLASEAKGRWFKSTRAHQFLQQYIPGNHLLQRRHNAA